MLSQHNPSAPQLPEIEIPSRRLRLPLQTGRLRRRVRLQVREALLQAREAHARALVGARPLEPRRQRHCLRLQDACGRAGRDREGAFESIAPP